MNISDQAVEAAAKAIRESVQPPQAAIVGPYVASEMQARAALEAAAPHIAERVWDEAASSIIDEHGNPIKPTNVTNPYRGQA
jgi:hypothetical protein